MITLTATLQDFTGAAIGSVAGAGPSKLCIMLCAFGNQIPRISGTAVIGRPGPIYFDSTTGSFSVALRQRCHHAAGTDLLRDLASGSARQCSPDRRHQLTGSGTFDLCEARPRSYSQARPAEALEHLARGIPVVQVVVGSQRGKTTFTSQLRRVPSLPCCMPGGVYQVPKLGRDTGLRSLARLQRLEVPGTITFITASIQWSDRGFAILQQPNGRDSRIIPHLRE